MSIGSWTNFEDLNNPTYEFYPPKNINGYNGTRLFAGNGNLANIADIGLQIPAQFLKDCKLSRLTAGLMCV